MILKFARVDFTVWELKIVAEIKTICTFRQLFVFVCVCFRCSCTCRHDGVGGGGCVRGCLIVLCIQKSRECELLLEMSAEGHKRRTQRDSKVSSISYNECIRL